MIENIIANDEDIVRVIQSSNEAQRVVVDQNPQPAIIQLNQGPQGERGPQGPPASGVLDPSVMLQLEFEESYRSNHKTYQFTNEGFVASVDVWSSSAMSTKLFSKVFTFINGVLTEIVTTRVSTGETLTKSFNFSNSVLTSVTKTFSGV